MFIIIMKKTLSILFALLIVLSGMHVSLAMHICEGALFAAKFSFSGKSISCGMESSSAALPGNGYHLSTECCNDHVAFFSVDHQYTPSPLVIRETKIYEIQVPFLPENSCFNFQKTSYTSLSNFSFFPGKQMNAFTLEDLCVFRIWFYPHPLFNCSETGNRFLHILIFFVQGFLKNEPCKGKFYDCHCRRGTHG